MLENLKRNLRKLMVNSQIQSYPDSLLEEDFSGKIPSFDLKSQLFRNPSKFDVCVDLLIIDSSISMDCADYPPTRLDAAKKACHHYLDQLVSAKSDRAVGVMSFGTYATLNCPVLPALKKQSNIRNAFNSIMVDGGTQTAKALEAASKLLQSVKTHKEKRIILLTDGHSCDSDETIREGGLLKSLGCQVDVIGIGGNPSAVNEYELRQIASVVNGQPRYWFIGDVGDLIDRFEKLAIRSF